MADRCIITIGSEVTYGDYWVVQPDLRAAIGYNVNMPDIAATNSTYATFSYQTFPKMLTSPDGETWTLQADFANKWTNAYVRCIKGFDDLFVVTGDLARIAFSIDQGETWTLNTNFGAVHSGAAIFCIGFDGTKFIAVTSDGKCASSLDLITWTDVPGFSASGWGTQLANEIIYGDGLWTACGPNGGVNTSTDGITWTYRPITGIPAFKTLSFQDMAYGKGRWVAVGDQCLCAYSPNGRDWTYTNNLDDSGWGATKVFGICFDGSRFVAVGDLGKIAKSYDGIIWSYDTTLIDDPLWTTGYDAHCITNLPSGQLTIAGQNALAANSTTLEPPPVPEVQYFYHIASLSTTLTRQPIVDGNLGAIDASIVVTGISSGSGDNRTLMSNGADIFVFCDTQSLNNNEFYRIDKDLTTIIDQTLTVAYPYPVGVCPTGFLNSYNGSNTNVYSLGAGMPLISSEPVDRLGSSEGATTGRIMSLQAQMDSDPWVDCYVDGSLHPYLPIDLGNITAQGYLGDHTKEFNWDLDYSANHAFCMPDNATLVMYSGKVYNRDSGTLINTFTPVTFGTGKFMEYGGDEIWMLTIISGLFRLPDYKNSAGGDANFVAVTGHNISSSADAILIA